MGNVAYFIEGTGYGHASRMVNIIKKTNGTAISFGDGARFLKERNANVVEISQNYVLRFDNTSLNLSATMIELIKRININDMKMIREIYANADVIVVDSSLLGLMLASKMGKPIILITNSVLASALMNGITGDIANKVNNLFLDIPSKIIIPDLPPPFTISKRNIGDINKREYIFTGPIVNIGDIKKGKGDFIAIANGAGFETDGFSIDIGEIKAVAKKGTHIKGEHIRYVDNIRDYIGKSKAVITHGGHTTIMECLLLGKPLLFIPNQKYGERINNIKGAEELGIGIGLNEAFINEDTINIGLQLLESRRDLINRMSKMAKAMKGEKRVIEIIESYLPK